MNQKPDLKNLTGAGVRIALIDSGINAEHSHVESVAGGIGFSLADDGTIQDSQDYSDQLGHGTALAGILRAKAPQAELYAVKIFADRLGGPIAVLEAGLRWTIEQHIQIINLSLGTNKPEHRERLATLVDQACTEGLILVASSPPGLTEMFPAALPGVIGVAGDDQCGWEAYRYIPNDPIPFRAHSQPRPLPGLPQERNFRGHSFASTHVSALLARQVQQHPRLTVEEAKAFLMTYPD